MFDSKQPTVQMLGRWQPWHDGHTELFKKALEKTGQVCIMVRNVQGIDDNPFSANKVELKIRQALSTAGFTYDEDFIILTVPNIVDISYGRGVGYTFTEHDLDKDIQAISATKIRANMRAEGKL